MKLTYFSARVDYMGKLSGSVQFSEESTQIMHCLSEAQCAELAAMIDRWKIDLMRSATIALESAVSNILAIEHTDNVIDGIGEVPF